MNELRPIFNRNFAPTDETNGSLLLKKELALINQPATPLPLDHYPTLTPAQKRMFFHYTATLHRDLTPWDALLFTIYKLRKICSFYLPEIAATKTEQWFAETICKLYTVNYITAFYDNNPNFQEERVKIASATALMILYLKMTFKQHNDRLKESQISLGTELQDAEELLTIAQIFSNHLHKDTLLEGRLSDLQAPCDKGNLTDLIQFCEFSYRAIMLPESFSFNEGSKREPTSILLQTTFLKKYSKESSLLPLDESQKQDILHMLLATRREKKRDSQLIIDEILAAPETYHLSNRCTDWFGRVMDSHHGAYYATEYQSVFIYLSHMVEDWKRNKQNPLQTSQNFPNFDLSLLPGHELIAAARAFGKDMEDFIFKHPIEKFNLFLTDVTDLLTWRDAVRELEPLIKVGETFFNALPDLMQSASTKIVQWIMEQGESIEDKNTLARGCSFLIYMEVLPILPFLLALKKLPTYFRITDPVVINEPDLENTKREMDFFEYLMKVLDLKLVEALHLVSEEFFVEQLATLVVEDSIEAAAIEKEEVDQTNQPVKPKPLSKREKNAQKKKNRNEKLEELQKKATEKSPDTTKETALVPLSIKREKLIKIVLEKFGGTCRINGGHLIFTTGQNKTVVIPAHGKTIAPGTVHSIIKQLGEEADDK